MEYGKANIVQRSLTKREREAVVVPEALAISVKQFHEALQKHVPRVEGQRPDRLIFIRPGGSTVYNNVQEAESGFAALRAAIKALGMNIWIEISPCPNPAGGSPLYQILGYLTRDKGERNKPRVNWSAV